jgi:predicted HTH domain antitoxin
MSTKPYALRIPQGLLELAEMKSKADRIDKATALRQLLYSGAEEYVLQLVSEGKLSMGRAAELLEMSVYDIQRLAQERDMELSATADQYKKARETTEKLGRKLLAGK